MARQPVTMDQAAQIEAAKAAAKLPVKVREQIQRQTLASQQVDMSKYYYSRVRFQGRIEEVPEEGTFISFDAGDRYAFSYQVRQEVDTHPGHRATFADTNLIDERSTNRGETVRIGAIAIRNTPLTDALLAAAADMFISVSMRLDNIEMLFLGNPSDIPGSSQLSEGSTWSIQSDAEKRSPAIFLPTRKGVERMENMLVLSEPLIWKPSGNDSKLDVKFTLNQGFRFKYDADRPETDPLVAPNYVTTWSRPSSDGYNKENGQAEPGTFIDFFVKLYCSTTGERSVNL